MKLHKISLRLLAGIYWHLRTAKLIWNVQVRAINRRIPYAYIGIIRYCLLLLCVVYMNTSCASPLCASPSIGRCFIGMENGHYWNEKWKMDNNNNKFGRSSPLAKHFLAGLADGEVAAREKNTRQDPSHQEYHRQGQQPVGYYHPSSIIIIDIIVHHQHHHRPSSASGTASIDCRVVIVYRPHCSMPWLRSHRNVATWVEEGEGRHHTESLLEKVNVFQTRTTKLTREISVPMIWHHVPVTYSYKQ